MAELFLHTALVDFSGGGEAAQRVRVRKRDNGMPLKDGCTALPLSGLLHGFNFVEIVTDGVGSTFQRIATLDAHPEFRAGLEKASQPEGGVWRQINLFARQPLNAGPGNANGARDGASGQIERAKEFLPKNFARMDGRQLYHSGLSLVIVHKFNIGGPVFGPTKTQAELIVDADRMLPDTIRLKRFETVCQRRPQIFETGGIVEHDQLAARDGRKISWKPLRALTSEDVRQPFIFKTFDRRRQPMRVSYFEYHNMIRRHKHKVSHHDTNGVTAPKRQ